MGRIPGKKREYENLKGSAKKKFVKKVFLDYIARIESEIEKSYEYNLDGDRYIQADRDTKGNIRLSWSLRDGNFYGEGEGEGEGGERKGELHWEGTSKLDLNTIDENLQVAVNKYQVAVNKYHSSIDFYARVQKGTGDKFTVYIVPKIPEHEVNDLIDKVKTEREAITLYEYAVKGVDGQPPMNLKEAYAKIPEKDKNDDSVVKSTDTEEKYREQILRFAADEVALRKLKNDEKYRLDLKDELGKFIGSESFQGFLLKLCPISAA